MNQAKELIVVVDDDWAVRDSLKFVLEQEGYLVETCCCGEELLSHPGLETACCILLDNKMPTMSGFEVLDRLMDRKIRVPVILMTGPTSSSANNRARAAGVFCILEKPLLDGALFGRLNDVVCRSTYSNSDHAS